MYVCFWLKPTTHVAKNIKAVIINLIMLDFMCIKFSITIQIYVYSILKTHNSDPSQPSCDHPVEICDE